MIQKKTPAARITELSISAELIEESFPYEETSPTSKDTPSILHSDPIQSEVVEPDLIKLQKDSFHHPQVIDQDVENFTSRLDSLLTQFRNESVNVFLTFKRSILHEQINTIDSEKKRCNALLSTKQDEIEHLKEENSKLTKSEIKNQSQKEALALMVGTLKMKTIAGFLINKAYRA